MPKMKTKKVVAKRFKVTKNGKILRGHQMGRHLRINKSKSQKRRLKREVLIHKSAIRKLKTFLPYS